MGQYGLDKRTMFPAYGLAEACLGVAAPNPSEDKIVKWVIDRRKMNIGDNVVVMDDKTAVLLPFSLM